LTSGAARCLRLPELSIHVSLRKPIIIESCDQNHHFIFQSTGEEMQGTTGVDGSTGIEEGARILTGSSLPASRDWLVLATALDRITFIVLLLIFIIIGIIYGC